jgi:hypothetical protein
MIYIKFERYDQYQRRRFVRRRSRSNVAPRRSLFDPIEIEMREREFIETTLERKFETALSLVAPCPWPKVVSSCRRAVPMVSRAKAMATSRALPTFASASKSRPGGPAVYDEGKAKIGAS